MLEREKTVRDAAGPRLKSAVGCEELLSWLRIFSEIGVMLCVVKRLAPAMSLGSAPPAIAPLSALRRALR